METCPHCGDPYQYKGYKHQKQHRDTCEANPEVIAANKRDEERNEEMTRRLSRADRLVQAIDDLIIARVTMMTTSTAAKGMAGQEVLAKMQEAESVIDEIINDLEAA